MSKLLIIGNEDLEHYLDKDYKKKDVIIAILPSGNVPEKAIDYCNEIFTINFKNSLMLNKLIDLIKKSREVSTYKEEIAIELSVSRDFDHQPKDTIMIFNPWYRYLSKLHSIGLSILTILDRPVINKCFHLKTMNESDECWYSNKPFDKEFVISYLQQRGDIRHVYNIGLEESQPYTYDIAEGVNLELNKKSVIQEINDKALMREALSSPEKEYNVTHAIRKNDDNLLNEEWSFPLIIKPSNLSGSIGVGLLKSEEDLRKYILNAGELIGNSQLLIEEYLIGREVSVEAITVNGIHQVVGITDKYKNENFVEMMHVFPSTLPSELIEIIETYTIDFLNTMGYRFGPSHTEFICTDKGVKLVESQTRFGGDYITQLMNLSLGMDIERYLFSHLTEQPDFIKSPQKWAAIRYLDYPNKNILGKKDKLEETLENHTSVISFNLKDIPEHKEEIKCSRDRLGYFLIESNELDGIYENINELEIEMHQDNIIPYK